ncbi:amidohydrolase family protein [Planctomicrobium sp. SH664]|uniref:amidohydrolase family protein n=1 Tax=Planctomicrobium sp. SH664 TaxID=3448125 RepID=UPI003F5B658D
MEHRFSRRQILTAGVATVAASTLANSSLASAAHDSTRRIDTHVHCFAGPEAPEFPYHPRAHYRPEAAATPEQLLSCMRAAHVNYAVVVHPEPYGDDHRYLEYCLEAGKGRLKGTLLLFADDPESMRQLPVLAEKLDVVAVRIHAYDPQRLPPFGKPELRRLWEQATEYDLAIQLHLKPQFAPGFEPLIRDFPNTTVLIDHMGRPFQGLPAEFQQLLKWSQFPNTYMKLSELPSKEQHPPTALQATIQSLVSAWGPDRLLYGGGFAANTTQASYNQAFDYCESFLKGLSVDDRQNIMGGNALKLFRFEA